MPCLLGDPAWLAICYWLSFLQQSQTLKGQGVTGQVNFNSHMDVVIRVAAELVNLLTAGEDRGRPYLPPEGDERTAAVAAVLRAAGGREATWEEAAELCFVAGERCRGFQGVMTG